MNEQLDRLVRLARNKSHFYHVIYNEVESFEQAPFVDEEVLAENSLGLIIDSMSAIVYRSAGKNFRRCYNLETEKQLMDSWVNCLSQFQPLGNVLLSAIEYDNRMDLISEAIRLCGGEAVIYLPEQSVSKGVQLINEYDVSTVIAGIRQTLAISQYINSNGSNSDIKRAIVLNEYDNDSIVRRIEMYLNCPVYRGKYIASCELLLGFEDDRKSGYKIGDNIKVEIVEKNSRQILENGEFGSVVFSTVNDSCQPVIRCVSNHFSRLDRYSGLLQYDGKQEDLEFLYGFHGLIDYYTDDRVHVIALSQLDEDRLYRELKDREVEIKYVDDYVMGLQ